MKLNQKQVRKKRSQKLAPHQRVFDEASIEPRVGLEASLKRKIARYRLNAEQIEELGRIYLRWAGQCLRLQAAMKKSGDDLESIKVWSTYDTQSADLSEPSKSILDTDLKDVIADVPLDKYPALARQYRLWSVQLEQLHAVHVARPDRLRMTLDPFTTSARAKLPLALAETVAGQDTLFVNELAFMFQDWADKLFGTAKDETDVYLAETVGTTGAVRN